MNTLRSSIALLALSFVTQTMLAQANTYTLNPEQTKEILQSLQKYPQVNQVTKKRFGVAQKVMQKTAAYRSLEKALKQLRADSTAQHAENQTLLKKYNNINEIKILIEKFHASSTPYAGKKKFLAQAQKLANTYNKPFMIYADGQINSNQISKYTVLRSNLVDLKVHHRRIIREIEKSNPKPQIENTEDLGPQLASVRNKMKSVKKFETVIAKKKKYTDKKLVIGNTVNSLSALSGTFKKLDQYYCMASNYGTVFKDQLLKKEALKSLKIPQNRIVSTPSQSMFTNIETGVLYIADSNFLDQFSVQEKVKQNIAKPKSAKSRTTAKIKSVVSYQATKDYEEKAEAE